MALEDAAVSTQILIAADRFDHDCLLPPWFSLVPLLVSGVGMPEAVRAQDLLADDWGVAADVWSVTSWGELRRGGVECEKQALRDPGNDAPLPYVTQALSDAAGPFVAASDWMRAVPDQIRQWVPFSYTASATSASTRAPSPLAT